MHATSLRTKIIALGLSAIAIPCCQYSLATADAPAITCTSLSVVLSSNKNYYVFKATASGDISKITGYTFGYGDKQSYMVRFDKHTTVSHQSASTTHVYQKNGAYNANVHVITANSSITSPACNVKALIGPPISTLPNTGATDLARAFTTASAVGITTYIVRLKTKMRLAVIRETHLS